MYLLCHLRTNKSTKYTACERVYFWHNNVQLHYIEGKIDDFMICYPQKLMVIFFALGIVLNINSGSFDSYNSAKAQG